MSGKVAKPKEDKDASKGKRRALPCTDFSNPKSQVLRRPCVLSPPPCMVLEPPSEVRPNHSSHWTESHSQHAASLAAAANCGPKYAARCVVTFEITCFACFALVIVNTTGSLLKPSSITLQTCGAPESQIAHSTMCHWHLVEMSLCVSRLHLIRIRSRASSSQLGPAEPFCPRSLSVWHHALKSGPLHLKRKDVNRSETGLPEKPGELTSAPGIWRLYAQWHASLNLCIWARFSIEQIGK